MSVQVFKGSFAKRTGVGTQTITGVGFKPKALIFWWTNQGAVGMDSGSVRWSMGFSDGANHCGVAHQGQDNVSGPDTSRAWRNDACLILTSLVDVTDSLGTVSALISDGFTVNWSAASGSAGVPIHFLAIGGDVAATVGDFTSSGSTGNQSITAVGFRPTCVFFLGAAWTTSDTNASDGFGSFGFGCGVSASEQWVLATDTIDAANPSTTYRYQRSDKCLARLIGSTVTNEAAFVSQDDFGFTVNWTTAAAGKVAYLALTGVTVKAGTFTNPAATGNQTIPTTGITPAGVIVGSVGATSNTAVQTQNRITVSGFDGTNDGGAWTGDEHNVAPSRGARWLDTTSMLRLIDTVAATGASSTVSAEASGVSVQADGFTVNWSTADATARELVYAAFGADSPAAGGGGGTMMFVPVE